MKSLVIFAVTLFALTGCRNRNQGEIVQETFLHTYGVPISKEDWVRNGKDGSKVELRTDGVTVTKMYEKGMLQGKSNYTFPHSSTIHFSETYDKGELVAKVEHYPTGTPMRQEKYVNDKLAERICWYEGGTPQTIETYEAGCLVKGEYRTELNELESKVEEGTGVRIQRGVLGELIAKDTFKDRELVEKVTYFPNGDPSAITSYEQGEIHGKRFTFIPGGLPHTMEEWICGVQEGTTVLYLNGEKISEITYVKGQKQGVEKRFKDGKLVVEEVSWKNDMQHGPRSILNEEGVPLRVEWYHEGELVSRPTFERMNVR